MVNKKKIYISSTFLDLNPYRDAVIRALRRDSFKEFITVVSAETASPTSALVWDRVESDVKECDYYFLLLADRYGAIYESSVNPERLSFTEHEFQVAIATKRKIIVFISGDKKLKEFADKGKDNQPDIEKQEKLAKLKAHEKLQIYGPGFFLDENGLVNQVQDAVINIISPHLPPRSFKHLFCNRNKQVENFRYGISQPQTFNTFIIYGDEMDVGQDLIKRICLRELDLPDDNVKIPSVDLNEMVLNPSHEVTVIGILNNFFEQLYGQRLTGNSVTEVVKNFISRSQRNNQNILLRIDITAGMLEQTKIEFLHYFVKTCSIHYGPALTSKLYIFLNISDKSAFNRKVLSRIFHFVDIFFVHNNTNKIVAKIINGLGAEIHCCYDTKRMEKINKRHIINWLTNELGKEEWSAYEDLNNKLPVFRKGIHDMLDVQKELYQYLNASGQ